MTTSLGSNSLVKGFDMKRRTRLSLLMAMSVVFLAVALAGSAGARPFLIDVADGGLKYSPKTAHVKKGKRIKWTNQGSGTHTVTFYKKPSGSDVKSFTLSAGSSKKRKPKKTGTYKYRCLIGSHSDLDGGQCSGMCGKLKIHT
jgi:plastocyanin